MFAVLFHQHYSLVFFFQINYVMSNGGMQGLHQCHQGSISSSIHEQLFLAKIPKVQKRLTAWLFFALLVSANVKAARKMLVKLTPNLKTDQIRFKYYLSWPFFSAFPVSTIRIGWSQRIAMIFSTRPFLLQKLGKVNHTRYVLQFKQL